MRRVHPQLRSSPMALAGPRSFYILLLAGIGGLVEESVDGNISLSIVNKVMEAEKLGKA